MCLCVYVLAFVCPCAFACVWCVSLCVFMCVCVSVGVFLSVCVCAPGLHSSYAAHQLDPELRAALSPDCHMTPVFDDRSFHSPLYHSPSHDDPGTLYRTSTGRDDSFALSLFPGRSLSLFLVLSLSCSPSLSLVSSLSLSCSLSHSFLFWICLYFLF